MVIYRDEYGNKLSVKETNLVNNVLSELTDREKSRYEKVIQYLNELFRDFNSEKCPHCKNTSWVGPTHLLKDGSPNNRGCCRNCAGDKGYYRSHRKDMFIFPLVEKYFNETDGFFDPVNMRCSLPRQLRSCVCLGYVCYHKEYPNIRQTALSYTDVIEKFRILQVSRIRC